MARITWILKDGQRISAEVKDGTNLMFAAVANNVPGVIGALGTTLGDMGVNIANFQLGRTASGEDAIAILYLDEALPASVLEALQKTGKFLQAKTLQFEV